MYTYTVPIQDIGGMSVFFTAGFLRKEHLVIFTQFL